MNNYEFVNKLKDIADNYKTLYVMGCIGAPMTEYNKSRYINNGAHGNFNAYSERAAMIRSASSDTFGFDCVCLIKAVLWGWSGNKNASYGGATYGSNGVPDVGTEQIINMCSNVSTDFSNIEVGELVHLVGHVGVYIGDGLVIECTPAWTNNVQYTACNGYKHGYNTRFWKDHGKLPWIEYIKEDQKPMTKEEKIEFEKLKEEIASLKKRADVTIDNEQNVKDAKCGSDAVKAVNFWKAKGVFNGADKSHYSLSKTELKCLVWMYRAAKALEISNG